MKPNPAATVVLVRQTECPTGDTQVETLLLLRNTRLTFMGGTWVFPGGKVDAVDYTEELADLHPDYADYLAALNAAVRETQEETGLQISPDDLIHIAHWTTPPGQSRRYATWFFLCPVAGDQQVTVDDDEILDSRWFTPAEALKAHQQGQIQLPIPTEYTLRSIASFASLSALCQAMHDADIHVFPEGSDHYRPLTGVTEQSHS